jgi:ABC-2 type transport system permease protein
MMNRISLGRIWAMLVKEFTQLHRDRAVLSIVLVMPIIQLLLYGYAVNADPHHIKTAVLVEDQGPFSRSVLAAIQNSGYFDIVETAHSPAELDKMMALGDVLLTITIPGDFTRRVVRHQNAQILVEADASDPLAIGGALGVVSSLPANALLHDLSGPLTQPMGNSPFTAVVHRRYNPESVTAYNIVPGMLGILLSMTLVMMTSSALTRERESGTLETLLATPVRPTEVMIGKIVPYIALGVAQTFIILTLSQLLFDIPMTGGWDALAVGLFLFIVGSLSLGFLISALSRTQRQAQTIATFYFLPSMMLSGFMFPFDGMPQWARTIGSVVPITHFLRIVRGSVLKGHGIGDAWPSLAALALFVLAVSTLAISRYRTTLD